MTITLLFFLIILYLSFRDKYSNKSKKKFIWIITVVLIFISGFRNMGVGNDTLATTMRFAESANSTWKEILSVSFDQYFNPSVELGKDPGYSIFNKLVSLFFRDNTLYLFLIAVILLGTLGRFFYKNSKDLRYLLFAYVFYITLFYGYLPNSAARQSLALALLLWGYMILQEDKRRAVLEFILFVLLASTFHKSSLIALLFLIVKIDSPKRIYVISFIGFILMLFLYQNVAMLVSSYSDIYEGYGTGIYYAQKSRPFLIVVLMAGLYALHFFVIKKDGKSKEYNFAYVGTGLTLILVPLIWSDPSVLRLISYFGVWFCIMVPHSLDCFKPVTRNLLFIVLLSIFVARAAISQDNYKFNWQHMELHERYG